MVGLPWPTQGHHSMQDLHGEKEYRMTRFPYLLTPRKILKSSRSLVRREFHRGRVLGADRRLGTFAGAYMVDILPALQHLPLFLKPWEKSSKETLAWDMKWSGERMRV